MVRRILRKARSLHRVPCAGTVPCPGRGARATVEFVRDDVVRTLRWGTAGGVCHLPCGRIGIAKTNTEGHISKVFARRMKVGKPKQGGGVRDLRNQQTRRPVEDCVLMVERHLIPPSFLVLIPSAFWLGVRRYVGTNVCRVYGRIKRTKIQLKRALFYLVRPGFRAAL